MKTDARGNKWYETNFRDSQAQEWLHEIRGKWQTATDEEISLAKKKVVDVFGGNADGALGQACRDFVYVFGADKRSHYFVLTETRLGDLCLMYEGECDMQFSAEASFDFIKMQRDLGM